MCSGHLIYCELFRILQLDTPIRTSSFEKITSSFRGVYRHSIERSLFPLFFWLECYSKTAGFFELFSYNYCPRFLIHCHFAKGTKMDIHSKPQRIYSLEIGIPHHYDFQYAQFYSTSTSWRTLEALHCEESGIYCIFIFSLSNLEW